MSKYKRYSIFIVLICWISLFFLYSMEVVAEDVSTIPVTETIYWGISNHVLTLSNSEVEGEVQNSFSSRSTITSSNSSWASEKQNIHSVVVQSIISPVDMSYWFNGFSNCTTFHLQNLDTSNTINMSNMFSYCENLEVLDITSFKTTNVTNMSFMFSNCSKLTSIDLSGLNTSNVTTMDSMFYQCSKLESVNLSSLDTSNVTNMRFMFYGCRAFMELDLSMFQIHKDIILNGMLRNLSSLKKITLSESIIPFLSKTNLAYNWYTENLTEYTSTHPIPSAGTYYKKCTVTFYGKDVQIVGKKDCLFNTTIDASDVEIPKNAGYLFEKWVTTRNGLIEFDFSIPITSDVSVYAGFVICSHDFDEWVITKETKCDEEGSRHRFCKKCSYEEIETIEKLPHVLGMVQNGVHPTCETDGILENQYCSVCEKYYNLDLEWLPTIVIPALGHDYTDAIVWQWENNSSAVAHLTCNVCNHSETQQAIVREEIITPASCLEEGAKKIIATILINSQEVVDEKNLVLPKNNHTYSEWIEEIPSKCIESGTKAHYFCIACNHNFDSTYTEMESILLSPLGHSYGAWEIYLKPTCLSTGIERQVCAHDSNHYLEREIEALGHEYSSLWSVDVVATCEEEGIQSHHCIRCDSTQDAMPIQALGHSYGAWEIYLKPTCLSTGIERQVCAHDSNHYLEREIEALGHEYSSLWSISSQGHYHQCIRCEEHQEIYSHTFDLWIIVTNPTTKTEGLQKHQCNGCGYEETQSIPILPIQGLSIGAILGIIFGCLFLIIICLYILGYFFLYKKERLKGKFFEKLYIPMQKIFKNRG